jgi:hypothetical protein
LRSNGPVTREEMMKRVKAFALEKEKTYEERNNI